jgi:hypothetical protein
MEVRVNGEIFGLHTASLSRVSDIVELIKTNIDPDHMITSVSIDGRDLEEADWSANPASFGSSLFEVETGLPEDYVRQRMMNAHYLVQEIFMQFRDARKSFQEGLSIDGNRQLGKSVQTFQAFIEWYGTVVGLLPEEKQRLFDITPIVSDLSVSCQSLCQKQLSQSWGPLADIIKNELEPKLEKLEDICRAFRQKILV